LDVHASHIGSWSARTRQSTRLALNRRSPGAPGGSDRGRVAVKLQRLIAAAAALDGRTVAREADLWPIRLPCTEVSV
jgi:hypothetical protein